MRIPWGRATTANWVAARHWMQMQKTNMILCLLRSSCTEYYFFYINRIGTLEQRRRWFMPMPFPVVKSQPQCSKSRFPVHKKTNPRSHFAASQWRIQGRGPGEPLFLDQNETRRAEKKFVWAPPLISRSGWPPPLYLKVWIRHCLRTIYT